MSEQKPGATCSINSCPIEGSVSAAKFKKANVAVVHQLIEAQNPVVVIIDAEWCGDCHNQLRNLPKFQDTLKSNGIDLYIFTAEGAVYDQFISPEHKALAMTLYHAPIGAPIFGERINNSDTTSVMANRGREGYPAVFFIAKGAVQHWSVEDVTEAQLEKLAKAILEKI